MGTDFWLARHIHFVLNRRFPQIAQISLASLNDIFLRLPDCYGLLTAGGRFTQISASALMIFVMDVVQCSENAMRFAATMRDR